MDSKPSSSFSISTKDNVQISDTNKAEATLEPCSKKKKCSSLEKIDNLTEQCRLSRTSNKKLNLVKSPHPEENAVEGQQLKKPRTLMAQSDLLSIPSEEFLQATGRVQNNEEGPFGSPHSEESSENESEDQSLKKLNTVENYSSGVVNISSGEPLQENRGAVKAAAASGSVTSQRIRVALVLEGYPDEMMTMEKLHALEASVKMAIINSNRANLQLRFHKCIYRPGHLLLICFDERTVKWLKETAPSLKPWQGAIIKVLEGDQLPNRLSYTTFIPDEINGYSASCDEILTELKIRNPTLNTHLWVECGTSSRELGNLWVFLIDPNSLEELQNLDMCPYFRTGRLRFHDKEAFQNCNCCV